MIHLILTLRLNNCKRCDLCLNAIIFVLNENKSKKKKQPTLVWHELKLYRMLLCAWACIEIASFDTAPLCVYAFIASAYKCIYCDYFSASSSFILASFFLATKYQFYIPSMAKERACVRERERWGMSEGKAHFTA